jgi:hypothetical protein
MAAVLAGVLIVALAVPALAQAPASPVTADQVDATIAKGIQYLWSQQRPTGLFGDGPWKDSNNTYPGGNEVCAMAVMAYAGEPLTKSEMQKGLKTLMEIELTHTYTLGLRLITLAELYRRADEKLKTSLRMVMKTDAEKLVSYQCPHGGWIYTDGHTSDAYYDLSNTQIAILALQQAVSCGVELKSEVFIKAMELYLAKQRQDGGWNYARPGQWETADSYSSMSAAAVASLYLMRDLLNPGAGCPCKGDKSISRRMPKVEDSIRQGEKWLADKFIVEGDQKRGTEFSLYWLYAIERVAIATGYKYIGRHDWYGEGSAFAIKTQTGNGSWPGGQFGATPSTAFAVLFLLKGRGPILLNKLKFDGEWDLHPRDAQNLCDYVGRLKEQRFNWQVINLEVPVEEMHDAPILYISAESPLKLTDEQKKKLRAFTDSGGTILFEASCGNRAADLAWKLTCQELWPEWELKMLDKDHPLWTADAKIVANRPLLYGASDGVRTFLFYSPRDISCAWNTMALTKSQASFDIAGNLYAYTTDRGKLRAKLAAREKGVGKKYAGQTLARGSKETITVARVKHGGDWYVGQNYHPWPLLASQFQVQSGASAPVPQADIGLTIKEVEPVAPGAAIPAGTNLLYLSGRTGCELGESGGQWLKTFVASGGFIFAEAVLGDKRFDEAAKTALQAAGLALKPLPADSPLLTGQSDSGVTGYNVTKVAYSFALRSERIGQLTPLLLGLYQGEKLVGVYSPFDIMFSLTGASAFGNRGYAVDDARAIAANIVLRATHGPAAPAPPSVEPAK